MKKTKTQKQKFLDAKFNIAVAACFAVFIGVILYVPALEYAKKAPREVVVRYEVYKKPELPKLITISMGQTTPEDYPENNTLETAEIEDFDDVEILIEHEPLLTRDLRLGDVHPEVKVLQKYLNSNGFLVAESGPGSPGQETERFGKATEEAVIRFQEAYSGILLEPAGLDKGTGIVGELTRAFINS